MVMNKDTHNTIGRLRMIRFGRRNGVCPEFSNFHNSPVVYDGVTYRNNECAFQAQKTLDKDERLKFRELSGNQAKQAGRKVLLRSDWGVC